VVAIANLPLCDRRQYGAPVMDILMLGDATADTVWSFLCRIASLGVRWMKAIRTINAILGSVGVVLLFFAVMARIDSHEAHLGMRVMDVLIGLMLAACFVLAREAQHVRRMATIAVASLIWLAVSVPLLLLHEFQNTSERLVRSRRFHAIRFHKRMTL